MPIEWYLYPVLGDVYGSEKETAKLLTGLLDWLGKVVGLHHQGTLRRWSCFFSFLL